MGWVGQDMGLVHDDQTVSIGTFSHAQTQEDYGQNEGPVESFARGIKKFHMCLDATNGTLLEKNQMDWKSALIGSQATRIRK